MRITIDTDKDDYVRWCRIQNFIEDEYVRQIKEKTDEGKAEQKRLCIIA